MQVKAILEKLNTVGVDFSKLGENFLTAIETEVDDVIATEVKTKLEKDLYTRLEAENDASILAAKKDTWHKEGRKGILDSIDSTLKDNDTILTDEEKTEYETLDTVKKKKYLFTKYKDKLANLEDKVKNADTSAERKALELEYNALKNKVETDYVPKSTIKEYEDKVTDYGRKLKELEKSVIKNEILTQAISTGKLLDATMQSDLKEEIIQSAINKYLETETFGANEVKAKIVLVNSKPTVRQADTTEDISIAEGTNVLTVKDIVTRALEKYNLSKKAEGSVPTVVVPTTGGDARKGLTEKELELAWN